MRVAITAIAADDVYATLVLTAPTEGFSIIVLPVLADELKTELLKYELALQACMLDLGCCNHCGAVTAFQEKKASRPLDS